MQLGERLSSSCAFVYIATMVTKKDEAKKATHVGQSLTAHARLLEALARYAYQYRPDEPFVLASGGTSPEYLDCRQALSHPAALRAAAECIVDLLDPGIDAIGGLTLGADPLSIASALEADARGRALRWFVVRKAPKGHGRGRRVEGDVRPPMRVAVVDDVATSGGSTLEAIRCCEEAGLEVGQVLVLVDREAGGVDAIRAHFSAVPANDSAPFLARAAAGGLIETPTNDVSGAVHVQDDTLKRAHNLPQVRVVAVAQKSQILSVWKKVRGGLE